MRLIIISNRLPITVKKHDTTFEYKQNSGGLVTGLKAVKESMPFLWLGNISGMVLNDDEKKTISKDCWELFKSIPVFVDAELNEMSYNGFCNGILWPLLHTFPDDVTFSETLFKAYTDYNQLFCEKVAEIAEEGDIIWVHDYHLMLLPLMLRQKIKKNIKIGYFLHTPFSIAEIFGSLPCAKEIIAGILGSDHVAFHSYDYLANFLDTCTMTMPNKKDFDPSNKDEKIMYVAGDLNVGNRSISFTAIPIGIDPKLFFDCIDKPETKNRIKELKAKFKNKTIILSVDRTDFIKGIPNRIKGYQRYLETSKNKDVVYMQIAVPSRADVPEYASLINTINTMTTELNSTVGNVDENYFYLANKSIPFEELCALYSVADICLISSLADGMNLVALEYIACQRDKKGILLLSEFAGCQSTLPGSIFFNSWNVNNIAKSIDYAIKMEKTEREERFKYNFDNVKTFTALKWAEDNVKSLQSISQEKVK